MLSVPYFFSLLLATSPASNNNVPGTTNVKNSFLIDARDAMARNDTDAAFQFLSDAFAQNANTPGLMSSFEDLFRLKIKLHNDSIDRMGLASLLSDLNRFEEAAEEFRNVVEKEQLGGPLQEKAASMLFRTEAANCAWKTIDKDSITLLESVRDSVSSGRVPAVHPYEALMWPCISIKDASDIATLYAKRAMGDFSLTSNNLLLPRQTVQSKVEVIASRKPMDPMRQRIKLGYISPDFTGRHPLAFLMQDVFRFHDTSLFEIYIYSPYESDNSPEVEKIKSSAYHWTVLSSPAQNMADAIRSDDLDILIDLCGYTGTSLIAEVMAHRVAPIQIGYMGFPASTGAPFIDFMICDKVVVPPEELSIRRYYSENCIFMPHCYFVNSHKFLASSSSDSIDTGSSMHHVHSLPEQGFVYCCHSRPEKIDPVTYRSWLRVIKAVRHKGAQVGNPRLANAVLWLLRSGNEMERNLREIATQEFELADEALVFADNAPRDDHLRRLKVADLFLDTPAYNAHTVGVDCLSAGVPMVSLLRETAATSQLTVNDGDVATEKLASRVGASLLKSIGLDVFIASTMDEYEAIMERCATDHAWFSEVKTYLVDAKERSPLFDTERWVKNLEAALIEVSSSSSQRMSPNFDVYVIDEG